MKTTKMKRKLHYCKLETQYKLSNNFIIVNLKPRKYRMTTSLLKAWNPKRVKWKLYYLKLECQWKRITASLLKTWNRKQIGWLVYYWNLETENKWNDNIIIENLIYKMKGTITSSHKTWNSQQKFWQLH